MTVHICKYVYYAYYVLIYTHVRMYVHTQMSHLSVYEKYADKIIKALPMEDGTFTAKLNSYGLIPGGVGDHIKSLPTKAEKAEHFLKNVIKESLEIDDTEEFENLLTVMEGCEYNYVKRLAAKIRSDLNNN